MNCPRIGDVGLAVSGQPHLQNNFEAVVSFISGALERNKLTGRNMGARGIASMKYVRERDEVMDEDPEVEVLENEVEEIDETIQSNTQQVSQLHRQIKELKKQLKDQDKVPAAKVKLHAKFDPKNPHLPLEDKAWSKLDFEKKKLAWAARDAMGIPRRRRRGIGALIAASRQEEDKRGIGAIMAVGREAEDSDEETVVEAEVISSDDDSDQDAKLPAKEPDEAPDERVAYYEGVSLNRKVMRTNMRKVAAIAAGVNPKILQAPKYRNPATTRRAQIYGSKRKASKQDNRSIDSVTS